MPRVRLKAKDYARNDFQAWIRNEMRLQKKTNAHMGELIGFTGQNYGRKLSTMFFSYDELVAILEELNCPVDRMVYFMTGNKVRS